MNKGEIEQVAHQLIADKIGAGEIVQMQWAVHEVVSSMGKIQGEGVEFYAFCANDCVYGIVKKCVERYDKPDAPDQLLLEGFDHMREAYTVKRKGKIDLVPVDQIADHEILARADQYERQSKGLIAHAEELRRFVKDRASKLVAV